MPSLLEHSIAVVCVSGVHRQTGTSKQFWFSDQGYTSSGVSTPPHTFMPPRLKPGGGFSRRAFSRGVSGRAESGFGAIVLENSDGALNHLTQYAFDGRQVEAWVGVPGAPFPHGFFKALVAVVKAVRLGRTADIRLELGTAIAAMDQPLSSSVFAGDNVSPYGVEGTQEDLKDQPKPALFGQVKNAVAPVVNQPRNIYQASQYEAQITAVYSAGSAMTRRKSYADITEFYTDPDGGEGFYDVYEGPQGTYFRLGSDPEFEITFDGETGASPTDRHIGEVIQAVLDAAGIAPTQFDLDVFPYEVGLWLPKGDETVAALFDRLAAATGAAWWVDRLGGLVFRRLEAPGAPKARITETHILSANVALEGPTGQGVPAKAVDVSYAKNEHPQSAESLAAIVSDDRKSFLGEPARHHLAEDSEIESVHPLAEILAVETPLVHEADAAALADHLLALHGTLRLRAQVEISMDVPVPPDLDIGDTLEVDAPCFAIHTLPMRIIGAEIKPAERRIKLDLWA